jgi:hypothetical protein
MFKDKNMPPGISLFLVLFLLFEIYYFFFDYLFAGLYPFHGYTLESLGYIPYTGVTLFLYIVVVFSLYKIIQGFILREDWARKFAILFSIWASIWPIWAIIIGNRVFENIVFFAIYVFIVLYLMSSYVKQYFEKIKVFTYGPYTLYTRQVDLKNTGKLIDIYFFSSHTPKSGTPCDMPEGYEVGVNQKTGMPYLQKIGKPKIFKYGDYTLYTRKVQLKNVGRQIDIYFFCKGKPKSGTACVMPDGYEVGVNSKTKLPYLRKKGKKLVKKQEPSKVEVPKAKKSEPKGEIVYKKPANVIYVVNKPQPGQVRGDWAVRSHGKIFSHHRTQENAIKAAKKIAKERGATVLVQSTSGAFRDGFKPKK